MNKEREVGGVQRESFRKAVAAGVKVVFGSDAAIYPHGDNARQLSRMVRFGMTSAEALRAATAYGGEAWAGDSGELLGRVAKGYLADLLLVDGDPLADLSLLQDKDRILMVMKDGKYHRRAVLADDVVVRDQTSKRSAA